MVHPALGILPKMRRTTSVEGRPVGRAFACRLRGKPNLLSNLDAHATPEDLASRLSVEPESVANDAITDFSFSFTSSWRLTSSRRGLFARTRSHCPHASAATTDAMSARVAHGQQDDHRRI